MKPDYKTQESCMSEELERSGGPDKKHSIRLLLLYFLFRGKELMTE